MTLSPSSSHPKHAKARVFYGFVEAGLKGKRQHGAGVAGVYDAVVSQAGGGVEGVALFFKHVEGWLFERRFFGV